MRLFVGKNCIPCKQLKAWLAANSIEIEQIVVEDNMEIATEAGVKSLPTLQLDDNSLIRGGEEIMEYFSEDDE